MVSPQWGCWERVWLNLKIRNWDTETSESERETQNLRESSQRRRTKYTKCLRERAGTEITGKDKRWIRMARKYPRGGGYKGGRNKSQCRRVNLRVLQSTMSRVEKSRSLTSTCPGKPVWRPRVILGTTTSAIWSIKMMHMWNEMNSALSRIPYLIKNCWFTRSDLAFAELVLGDKSYKKKQKSCCYFTERWREAEHQKSPSRSVTLVHKHSSRLLRGAFHFFH